jgi:hypothetical protein
MYVLLQCRMGARQVPRQHRLHPTVHIPSCVALHPSLTLISPPNPASDSTAATPMQHKPHAPPVPLACVRACRPVSQVKHVEIVFLKEGRLAGSSELWAHPLLYPALDVIT